MRKMEDIFKDIRPYNDEEVKKALIRIARHPLLDPISSYLFPEQDSSELRKLIASLKTVKEFQEEIMDKSIKKILKKTSGQLTYSGIENITANGKHLYVSNHRDILLDSAIIQIILFKIGVDTSELAVGDNLITEQFIEDVARSNKMIKVVRSSTPRELYYSSLLLSKYIRRAITTNTSSVWIAQRNGRTKDGIDLTEQGLLKMFDMSGNGDFTESFTELSIVPVSISYQFEPCDFLKAKEIYVSKRQKYEKAPGEDLVSILTGILQQKGNIHLHFSKPIKREQIEKVSVLEKNEKFKALADIIDSEIVKNFKIWDNNYIAYDLINNSNEYKSNYEESSLEKFKNYYNTKLSEFPYDKEEIEEVFLSIYSNPIINKQHY